MVAVVVRGGGESRLPRGGASRRTVNSVKHRLQPRVSARGRA